MSTFVVKIAKEHGRAVFVDGDWRPSRVDEWR